MAAQEGRTEVVSLLLKAGANIDLQNKVHVGVHVQVVWEEIYLNRVVCEGGAPERGDPPKGGVGNAPDHSSSTCRRLGERGF